MHLLDMPTTYRLFIDTKALSGVFPGRILSTVISSHQRATMVKSSSGASRGISGSEFLILPYILHP
jgi:hypothetical protein